MPHEKFFLSALHLLVSFFSFFSFSSQVLFVLFLFSSSLIYHSVARLPLSAVEALKFSEFVSVVSTCS